MRGIKYDTFMVWLIARIIENFPVFTRNSIEPTPLSKQLLAQHKEILLEKATNEHGKSLFILLYRFFNFSSERRRALLCECTICDVQVKIFSICVKKSQQ